MPGVPGCDDDPPAGLALAVGVFAPPAVGEDKKDVPQPAIVKTITGGGEDALEKVNPPNLVVTAWGQAATAGYASVNLARVVCVMPPADGIQDDFLLATPPSGMAGQMLSTVEGKDTWNGIPDRVNGVRVHGVDAGVVVKMIGRE